MVNGWWAEGERVVGLSSSGPLTTADRGLIGGLAGPSGSEPDLLHQPRRFAGPAKRPPHTRRRQQPHNSGTLQDHRKRPRGLNCLQHQG